MHVYVSFEGMGWRIYIRMCVRACACERVFCVGALVAHVCICLCSCVYVELRAALFLQVRERTLFFEPGLSLFFN